MRVIHSVTFEKHTFAGETFWVVAHLCAGEVRLIEAYPPKKIHLAKQRYKELQVIVRKMNFNEEHLRNLPQVGDVIVNVNEDIYLGPIHRP